MHAPFGGMHQEPEMKNRPTHQAAISWEELFSEPRFRTSSGFLSAQGTVASSCPVAESGVAAELLLMHAEILGPFLHDVKHRFFSALS